MVSLKQTNSAAQAVQWELYKIGLWNENTRLANSEIYWSWLPFVTVNNAVGIFTHGVSTFNKLEGLQEGHIYIPKWVLAQGFWQKRGSLKDIIRHEYGHALTHHYPELIIDSSRFEKCFGGNYYDYTASSMRKESFISIYASTMPCEDFAETVMVYVRRKGIIPEKYTDKKLINKWNFISDICLKIK